MISYIDRVLDQSITVLDSIRLEVLRRLGSLARPFIRSRSLRVGSIALVGFAGAILLALKFPLWQLALGPIILGIPHLLGDLRYLILHRQLHHSRSFWLLVVLPLVYFTYHPHVLATMVALWGAGLVAIHQRSRLDPTLSDTPSVFHLKRILCLSVIALFGMLLSYWYPKEALFTLLHSHNVITLSIWWFWRSHRGRTEWVSLLCLMIASVIIVFGWDASEWRQTLNTDLSHPAYLSLPYFEATLAMVFPEAWRPQVVVLYALLQSAHYLVWIRLIPEDDRIIETPVTFRSSLKRLRIDFGRIFLLLTLTACCALIIWSIFDVAAARLNYLRWISAHASLEIATLGYLFVARLPLKHNS